MKKPWKWVITGAVLLLVSPLAHMAVSLEMQTRALQETAATATHFLRDLNTHDYAGAHALLDAPQQRVIMVAAIQTAEEHIEKMHGKPLGKPVVDEYHPNQGLTSVTLSCDNAYQKENEPIRVVMVKAAGGWRVSEYQYDFSPA